MYWGYIGIIGYILGLYVPKVLEVLSADSLTLEAGVSCGCASLHPTTYNLQPQIRVTPRSREP